MIIDYIGVKEINGSLITLDGIRDATFEETVLIRLENGTERSGRIVQMEGDRVVIQVFEGTNGLSLSNTRTRLQGHPVEMPLSPELLGRIFDGAGRPADGLGSSSPVVRRDINGTAINPVSRVYPRNYIETGISSIDCMMTLIRGQKLPIFSGSGMRHNELAAQIARQAKIADESGADFAIVFAAMGVTNDVADYFRRSFEDSGVLGRVAMFLNLSSDPIIERILTPRCALTAAEYLAFDLNMHILVILTDMTAYAEALREFSASKGEIPGRKGYPGYLYSDLASIYERAGMIQGSRGSVTQIPILTMPNDDITHPVPDLTGYITEGQIVLDRSLDNSGSIPRLGAPLPVPPDEGRHRRGLYAGRSRCCLEPALCLLQQSAGSPFPRFRHRGRRAVPTDKQLLAFGRMFDEQYINQGMDVNRSIDQTLDLGWRLLSTLPREELDRVDSETLDKYYHPDPALPVAGTP